MPPLTRDFRNADTVDRVEKFHDQAWGIGSQEAVGARNGAQLYGDHIRPDMDAVHGDLRGRRRRFPRHCGPLQRDREYD